jgi:hypothetical protein
MDSLERLVRWKDALMERLRARSWKAWLFLALVAVFIEEVMRSFFVQGTTWLVRVLWETLSELIARPMGLGGLALLIWAALLLLLAYLDSRPRKEPPPAEVLAPRVRSLEEKEEIQALRTLWNLYFQPAAATCRAIYDSMLSRLDDKRLYWWTLAQPASRRLYTAMVEMSEAVADESYFDLETVQARQNEVYGAYWGAAYWVAKIAKEEGIDLTQVPTPRELERWRERHNRFIEKLREFGERPAQRDIIIKSVQLPSGEAFELLMPETQPQLSPIKVEARGTVTPPASTEPPSGPNSDKNP